MAADDVDDNENQGDSCDGVAEANGGEDPRAVTLLAALAAVLQFSLPAEYATRPPWLIPSVALVLSVVVFVTHLQGIGTHTKVTADDEADREDGRYRIVRLMLIGLLALANTVSAIRLVVDVLQADQSGSASRLLLSGATIWVTNIIVFALWYWEMDWKGPWYRTHHWHGSDAKCDNGSIPDFLFPQMDRDNKNYVPAGWRPEVLDYLYLSFTNAAAFSPTDVMPLSRPAKMTMLVQSAISLAALALLVSRAVNVLN